ncbi:hypothetical protein JCM11641_007837 [Rhodosporidiobolus odoratus]
MPTFAELRAKAESAATSARSSLPAAASLKPVKYEPVRPGYGPAQQYPSVQDRRKQSTAIQFEASKHVPPPPPRRVGSSSSTGETVNRPGPSSAGRGPPPTPARKPVGFGAGTGPAPPPLPTRRDSTPAPPYAPSLPARGPRSPTPPYASPPSPRTPPVGPASPPPPLRRALSSAVSAMASQTESAARARAERVQTSKWKMFSEYDERDKEDMFDALDLFFNARSQMPTLASTTPPQTAPSPAPYLPPSAPPPVALSTRPRLPATTSSSSSQPFAPTLTPPELHAPSYPLPQSHSSSALSLLHWIHHHPFTTSWFADPSSPLPPPLIGRNDVRFTVSWSRQGDQKQTIGCALFGDSSVLWYRLSWSARDEETGRAHFSVSREGRYRPKAPPLDADQAYEASERYGPLVVQFAERALAEGVPVGRGECWDLANSALGDIQENRADVPPPFPSIGRTHGSLLFYANANANAAQKDQQGRVVGCWTSGDVYIRPGDVVEWRKVKIRTVDAPRGGYSLLGDPDHTALILSAASPTSLPTLSPTLSDPTYPLSSLTSLTVLEQSLGHVPSVAEYDLSAMTKGEIWIYRPCGMKALCGIEELRAEWPVGKVECWELGELGE